MRFRSVFPISPRQLRVSFSFPGTCAVVRTAMLRWRLLSVAAVTCEWRRGGRARADAAPHERIAGRSCGSCGRSCASLGPRVGFYGANERTRCVSPVSLAPSPLVRSPALGTPCGWRPCEGRPCERVPCVGSRGVRRRVHACGERARGVSPRGVARCGDSASVGHTPGVRKAGVPSHGFPLHGVPSRAPRTESPRTESLRAHLPPVAPVTESPRAQIPTHGVPTRADPHARGPHAASPCVRLGVRVKSLRLLSLRGYLCSRVHSARTLSRPVLSTPRHSRRVQCPRGIRERSRALPTSARRDWLDQKGSSDSNLRASLSTQPP